MPNATLHMKTASSAYVPYPESDGDGGVIRLRKQV